MCFARCFYVFRERIFSADRERIEVKVIRALSNVELFRIERRRCDVIEVQEVTQRVHRNTTFSPLGVIRNRYSLVILLFVRDKYTETDFDGVINSCQGHGTVLDYVLSIVVLKIVYFTLFFTSSSDSSCCG